MGTVDYLVLAILALILGAAIFYIRRSRKKGVKCIGCPSGRTCSGNCSGHCAGCSGDCGKS